MKTCRATAQADKINYRQTASILPAAWRGTSSAADIQLSPDGRRLYASNRGHDSLAVFAIGCDQSALEARACVPVRGRWTRQFRLTADQASDTITVFAVDPAGGGLSPVGDPFPVPTPVCLTFLPG